MTKMKTKTNGKNEAVADGKYCGAALGSAPPPWHSVALVVLMASVCVWSLVPAFRSLSGNDDETEADGDNGNADGVASVGTFTRRIFPKLVSLEFLVLYRAACATVVFGVSVHMVLTGQWEMVPPYLPQSKLKRGVKLKMVGLKTLSSFTVWSWNLLGASFALNAYAAHRGSSAAANNDNDSSAVDPRVLRLAVWMFEVSGPTVLLIGAVVKYALWPQAFAHGRSDPLKTWRALTMHNVNVVMVLVEVALLGGLPVRWRDFPVACMYGLVYVLFAWSTRLGVWAPKKDGPQFIYFFFDTTLGWTATYALVALLLVLAAFYGLFAAVHEALEHLGGGVTTHAAAALLIAALVCRFRD